MLHEGWHGVTHPPFRLSCAIKPFNSAPLITRTSWRGKEEANRYRRLRISLTTLEVQVRSARVRPSAPTSSTSQISCSRVSALTAARKICFSSLGCSVPGSNQSRLCRRSATKARARNTFRRCRVLNATPAALRRECDSSRFHKKELQAQLSNSPT